MLLVIAILLLLFVLSPALGIVVVAIALVFEVGELVFWRRVLRRYRIRSGPETMVGEAAEVVEPLDPGGRVRLHGELWKARLPEGTAQPGERVRVTAVEGLELAVEPVRDEQRKRAP
jgi:membrane protein implicated in regulation of membrane protease activity